MCAVLQIPAEPDGGKVSPAQFPDHVVPPVKQITNIHRVVSTWNTEREETGSLILFLNPHQSFTLAGIQYGLLRFL